MAGPTQGGVFVYPGHGQPPSGFHSPAVHRQAPIASFLPGSLRVPSGRSQPLADWRQVHLASGQMHAVQAPVMAHLVPLGGTSRSFAPGSTVQPAVPAGTTCAQRPVTSLLHSMRTVERQQTVVPYPQNIHSAEQGVHVAVAVATPKSQSDSRSVQPATSISFSWQSISPTKQHGIIHPAASETPNASAASAPSTGLPQQSSEPTTRKCTQDRERSHIEPRLRVNPPSPVPPSKNVARANVDCFSAEKDRDLPRLPCGSVSPVLRSRNITADAAADAQPRYACHSPSTMATSREAARGVARDVAAEPDSKLTQDQARAVCRQTSPEPDCRKVLPDTAAGAAKAVDEDGSHVDPSHRCRSPSPPCVRKTCSASSAATGLVPDHQNLRAQTERSCPLRSPTPGSRKTSKASNAGANSVHSSEPNGQHTNRMAPTRSSSADTAFPLSDMTVSKRVTSHTNRSTHATSPFARARRRKTSVPRQSVSPMSRDSGRLSLYPRVGPDQSPRVGPERSPTLRRRTVCHKGELDSSSVAAEFATDVQQNSVDRRAEVSSTLAQLLVTWMCKRHMTGTISAEETDLVTDILFETMPSDKVKIVRIDRMMQPELISNFCKEELDSITRERENQKKHKEFMMLHGTRWENVPLICSMGLDPNCGHLTPGTWLGQNAESAHSYAAKGPGPGPFHDGHRLFAMFVVAALPSYADGDEERSFGVWRMMSSKRMCPAYLVIYSAPLNMRVRRPSRSASRAASPEGLSQPCRERCQRHSTPGRQQYAQQLDASSLLEEDRGFENRLDDLGKLA